MTMRTLILVSALFVGLFGSIAADPTPVTYHAFCRTLWLFGAPCSEIGVKLVQQIQAFDPLTGCAECQYTLVSSSAQKIKANHTSMDGLQVEKITFTLSPTIMSSGCRVSAESNSLGFTSLLDNGRNYCNLYNLLSASDLNSEPGFVEMINEWACLGYGLATCND